ncbi:MAG: hypothetical protein IJ035_08860, partial [Oscillospiraceae bacterium]|nr:hypothetical protein [Oscillospiraceae bacterium]
MKKGKGLILILAAVLSAVIMGGCREEEPEWVDTLPATLSEPTTPTAVCETEETTTTTEPTVVTTEKTKRTAASETTPELATTTSAAPTSPTLPTDISNVPVEEHTSSTAHDPSTEMKPTTNPQGELPSSETGTASSADNQTDSTLTG